VKARDALLEPVRAVRREGLFARILASLRKPWAEIAAALPRVGTFVLAIALTVTVTAIALRIEARRSPAEPVQTVPSGDLTGLNQPADIAPIAYLFGARPDSGSGDLKLVGVIAEGVQGKGIALLSLGGKPAQAARAGKQLAPDLVLVEVRKDRVVVNRAGSLQEVRMAPRSAPAAGAANVPLRDAQANSPTPPAPSGAVPPPAGAAASPPGPPIGRRGGIRRPLEN
jgi:general secretion pathway protein C